MVRVHTYTYKRWLFKIKCDICDEVTQFDLIACTEKGLKKYDRTSFCLVKKTYGFHIFLGANKS